MDRRRFLKFLSAVPIGAVIAEPVARTIFLPPRGGWWSNLLAKPAVLSEEAIEDMLIELRDTRVALTPSRLIVSPQFYKILKPKLEEIFSQAFEERKTDWAKLYG